MDQDYYRKKENTEINADVVDRWMKSITGIDGKPLALILPKNTGEKMFAMVATALKQLENTPTKLILIVSPLQNRDQILSTGCKILTTKSIWTSVGEVAIDQNYGKKLAAKLKVNPVQNEVEFLFDQYPVVCFLARVCPDAKLIPVMIGQSEIDLAAELGYILADEFSPLQPVVISISNLDTESLSVIEYCDGDRFIKYTKENLKKFKTDVALTPIISAIIYSNQTGGKSFSILGQFTDQNTGQSQPKIITSAMFWKYFPPKLNQIQKDQLVRLGFDAIREYLKSGIQPLLPVRDEILKRKSGVFVTLRQNSVLKGCIGKMSADEPLFSAIQSMSVAAATSDPRFPPLKIKELPQISLKISILSPLKRIDQDQVEIGRHGLLINYQRQRGVLLPEVPVDRNWDKHTFLKNLCYKAGLDPEILKKNPLLYGFTTIEFENTYQNLLGNNFTY